jgi:hypothetical protein
MALLIIEHIVGDFETFKSVDTVVGEPNNVRVVLGFDTAERARKHAEGLELHDAIKWATGNVSTPSFVVLEQVMDADA